MYVRFTRTVDLQTVAQRFGVATMPEERTARARYNIEPTQALIVVGDDGEPYLTKMHSGLIPFLAKDAAIGNQMINARAETLSVNLRDQPLGKGNWLDFVEHDGVWCLELGGVNAQYFISLLDSVSEPSLATWRTNGSWLSPGGFGPYSYCRRKQPY